MQFLYNLQKKPKHVRNNYALALASTFTGMVALFWFVGTASQVSLSGSEVASNEERSPFSNLIKQSKEQLANVSGYLNKDEVKETEMSKENINPLNITLNQEDIDIAKQNEPDPNQVYISTTTLKNDSSLFDNKRTYREVMIATTSSSSTVNTVDESATTSDSWF